jgi:hypothetical protein
MPLRVTFNDGNQNLSASFLNADTLDASLNSTVYIPELYDGPYNVTPSESVHTLATQGFGMAQNVTVQPIPSEYVKPDGTITITQNGVADVGEYKNARVEIVSTMLYASGRLF